MPILEFDPDCEPVITSSAKAIPVDCVLEARIMEVLDVKPFKEEDTGKVSCFAFCYLLYDRDEKVYYSTWERITCKPSSLGKLFKILSAIINAIVNKKNMGKQSLDMNLLVGKHIGVVYKSNPNGYRVIKTYSHIPPVKYTEMSINHYVRPEFIDNILVEDTAAPEHIDIHSSLLGVAPSPAPAPKAAPAIEEKSSIGSNSIEASILDPEDDEELPFIDTELM